MEATETHIVSIKKRRRGRRRRIRSNIYLLSKSAGNIRGIINSPNARYVWHEEVLDTEGGNSVRPKNARLQRCPIDRWTFENILMSNSANI